MTNMIATWTAGNGQQVTIGHKVSCQNIADHTFEVECDEFELTLGGQDKTVKGFENDLIESYGVKIRVPAEHLETVKALYNQIKDRRAARLQSSTKASREYQNGYNKIAAMMAE